MRKNLLNKVLVGVISMLFGFFLIGFGLIYFYGKLIGSGKVDRAFLKS